MLWLVSTMAEREGFEPSTPVAQCTRFPGGRLRPLSHLSNGVPSSKHMRFEEFSEQERLYRK